MYKRNGNKGITLIALVITIIVLLILAGVSIAMLTGDNSILANATKVRRDKAIGDVREEALLAITTAFTDYHSKEATKTLGEGESLQSITYVELKKVETDNANNSEMEVTFDKNNDGKFTARYKKDTETALEGTLNVNGIFTWEKK